MTFLYPLGLWGLIGIPILIIVYIIKSKYTEQTVPSTYLWTLSQRFLKKRNPLSRLTGIISLILQIMMITLVSLAIAHPMILLPGRANEYCFVIDGSGSMTFEQDGVSRFERSKQQIAQMIESSVDGSTYTLVFADRSANTVFEDVTDKAQAQLLLSELQPGYGDTDTIGALSVAQKCFFENPRALTYLFSDTEYGEHKNVTVINVASGEKNFALTDVKYELVSGALTLTGAVVSYSDGAELTLELYTDGANETAAVQNVAVKANERTPFKLVCKLKSFSSLRVRIAQTDSQPLDNECIIYNAKSDTSHSTLLVSDRPFFIESVFAAVGYPGITVISPEDYTGESGYNLYIFDSYDPAQLPRDGAVWLINPTGSVFGSGFSVQTQVTLDRAEEIELSDSSASDVRERIEGLSGEGIYISRYTKCGLYRDFATLFTYRGNPLIFTGTNLYGNRTAVFAFDIHDSNIALMSDFAVLTRNLIEFSFPEIIDQTLYYCGEEMSVNVLANCNSIRVDSPRGNAFYIDASGSVSRIVLDEVGVYNVTMTLGSGVRSFSVYSCLGENERVPAPEAEAFSLEGEAQSGGQDGTYDPMLSLFIVLAIVFAAEWVVYCYEKYQLR